MLLKILSTTKGDHLKAFKCLELTVPKTYLAPDPIYQQQVHTPLTLLKIRL